ncbi:hypothetical protein FHS70_002762 [Flammeovirga yaeyamensis]|nr:hypothetical protein [Flammeovirga yaeyamensis]
MSHIVMKHLERAQKKDCGEAVLFSLVSVNIYPFDVYHSWVFIKHFFG